MDSGTRQKIPSVWLDFGFFPVFYSAVWMESPAVFVKSVGEISEDIKSEGRQNKILEKTDS